MSLEVRNLAYNNVEHVGPDNARKKKRKSDPVYACGVKCTRLKASTLASAAATSSGVIHTTMSPCNSRTHTAAAFTRIPVRLSCPSM